jgi:hypothetical protein
MERVLETYGNKDKKATTQQHTQLPKKPQNTTILIIITLG